MSEFGKDINVHSRKGVFIPYITVEMFRNAPLAGVEELIANGEMEDISLPSAEPERPRGKWNFIGDNMFECTCCGVPYTTQQLNGLRNYDTDPYAPKFCPNCGADMRQKENDNV